MPERPDDAQSPVPAQPNKPVVSMFEEIKNAEDAQE